MAQTFIKVETEIFGVDSDLVSGWRQVRPHLNIGATEVPRPTWKQLPRDAAVNITNPFRRNTDVIGRLFQQGIEAMRNVQRNAFGYLGIGERTGNRRQFARGI
ncbi:MAG: hypothetical protein A3H31_02570 [Gallionellales bacterium RIFCSPLOWO2_02_FULL_57_47]|nr:MAG: hypothetical protein A3H31_02570 [Gallionellales bacterium RIFCSPLOWO2_02_FULL_57_47]